RNLDARRPPGVRWRGVRRQHARTVLEVGEQCLRRQVTPGAIPRGGAREHASEGGLCTLETEREVSRLVEHASDDLLVAETGVKMLAGIELVEDHAERVEIGTAVDVV